MQENRTVTEGASKEKQEQRFQSLDRQNYVITSLYTLSNFVLWE